MKDVMIYVERIVRPLPAEESTKLRMRRELLAHLSDILEDERKITDDPELVTQRAIARMGDPAETALQLRESIPWYESFAAWSDNFVRPTASTNLWRHALRMAVYCGGIMGAMILLVAARDLPGLAEGSEHAWMNVKITLAIWLVWTINMFTFSLLAGSIRRHIEHEERDAYTIASLVGLAVVTVVDTLATGWLLMFAVTGEISAFYSVLWLWAALAAVAVALMLGICWFDVIQLRGLKEWLELEIGD